MYGLKLKPSLPLSLPLPLPPPQYVLLMQETLLPLSCARHVSRVRHFKPRSWRTIRLASATVDGLIWISRTSRTLATLAKEASTRPTLWIDETVDILALRRNRRLFIPYEIKYIKQLFFYQVAAPLCYSYSSCFTDWKQVRLQYSRHH